MRSVLSAILLFLVGTAAFAQVSLPWPGPGGAGLGSIGALQLLGSSDVSTGTQNFNYGNAVVNGDMLILVGGSNCSTGRTIASAGDGTNTLSKAVQVAANSSQLDDEIWYKGVATAKNSGTTFTVTWSGACAAGTQKISLWRLTGVTTLDQIGSNTTTSGSTVTVTTAALATAREIAFGSIYSNTAGAYSAPAGFTNVAAVQSSGVSLILDDQLTAATTAISYAPSQTGATILAATVATFK